MSTKREIKHIALDDLAAQMLSERKLAAIEEMLVGNTVEPMRQWEASDLGVRFVVTNGKLVADARIRVSIKKLLASITGVISVLWAAVAFVIPHLLHALAYFGIS